jgi:hypothetical protein
LSEVELAADRCAPWALRCRHVLVMNSTSMPASGTLSWAILPVREPSGDKTVLTTSWTEGGGFSATDWWITQQGIRLLEFFCPRASRERQRPGLAANGVAQHGRSSIPASCIHRGPDLPGVAALWPLRLTGRCLHGAPRCRPGDVLFAEGRVDKGPPPPRRPDPFVKCTADYARAPSAPRCRPVESGLWQTSERFHGDGEVGEDATVDADPARFNPRMRRLW